MNTFVIPIMLDRLGWKTFVIFGCFNFCKSPHPPPHTQNPPFFPPFQSNSAMTVFFPIIYLVYPEVSGRTLEEVNLLFTSDSLLVRDNMKEYHRMIDEAGGNVAVAERRLLDMVDAEAAGHEEDREAIAEGGKEKEGVHEEHVEK